MPILPTEPSVRLAAIMTQAWCDQDFASLTARMAALSCLQEAEDVITSLLLMRDKPMTEIRAIAAGE